MAYDSGSDRVILFGGERAGWGFFNDTWAYDFEANTWTNMDPVVKPSGRRGHAMAYDSGSDRVILFGGLADGIFGDTWAYDFEANTWTNMDPVVKPSGRFNHAMAYDSGSDRVILFGGFGTSPDFLDDTWAYDFEANTWTNMDPAARPLSRNGHSMAYDAQSDRMILFSGANYTAYLNDTWAYDFNTNTWTNMDPAARPSARVSHAMVYDSGSDRVILSGGESEESNFDDTWAYDFEANTWTNMDPVRPLARWRHAMAYDSQSDRVFLFGGCCGGGGYSNDTWAYDFEANTWIEVTPRPTSSYSILMAYDSESDRVILVTWVGEIWAYDYDSDTWIKRNAGGPLSGSSIAYDSESDRVIIIDWWGGTWAYDYNTNTWTNMDPVVKPPGRARGSEMAYDSGSDRVILFGGFDGVDYESFFDDTWAYDYNTNTWTNMDPVVKPPGRYLHAMAYDSQSDRVILFGGLGASFKLPDTWAYDFEANTWTKFTPSSGPMGRATSAAAYDIDHDRIILYGGWSTDNWPTDHSPYGDFNDTWAYDFDTNTWTNLKPSSDPGPRTGPAMAYDSQSHVVVLFGGQSDPFSISPPNLGPWWYRYPESAPTSPRSLRAFEGNRQVTLTWEAPDYDGGRPIAGYRIYRFTWPEGLSIVATVGLVLTFTDTGLTNGVLYYYWVSALNAIGDGTLSETAAATPRLTLSAPVNLQAAGGKARVVLTWQPASSGDDSPITGYRIYRGTSLDSLTTAASVGNVLTYVDTNVTNGVTYYYRASALIGPDEGPRSREAMAMPTESTKPTVAILSPADGTTLTSTSVIVSGSASDDTAIQRVELSRDGTNWVTVTGTTSWSGSVNLGEGVNMIYARATDTSGNTGTMSISVTVSNPVLASLSSPIVIAAVAAGIAAVVGAVLIRRWRDRRWERK